MPAILDSTLVKTVYPAAQVIASPGSEEVLPGGVVIDASVSYDGANTGYPTLIRAGWLLAKRSNGKWCPVKRTQANGNGSSTATLVVDNAAAFKAGDALVIGSTSGTVSSIDYSTNTITLTATKTWSDNDVVTVTGYETALAVLGEDVDLYHKGDQTNYDTTAGIVYTKGMLVGANIKGDLAAVRAISGNAITKNFTVDSDYQ